MKDLIRSINYRLYNSKLSNSKDNYYEKYMKTKFNSDDGLLPKKRLKF